MFEISQISSNSTATLNKINQRDAGVVTKKKTTKTTHVPTACINCKKAHLACDLSRPCKRCTALDKCDTCIDIKHKKRGRPKLTATKKWQAVHHDKLINRSIPTPTPPATTTNTSNNFISLLPMTAPGLSACAFNLTSKNNINNIQKPTADQLASKSEMMTIFLSMDLCCARVSDESIDFLKLHPKEINHCSFYDLIHPESSETLSRIHRLLLDNSHSNRVPQQQPISFTTTASSDLFLTSSPAQLFQIANGSQTLRETLKFKSSGKNMSCRFYLGGGFGADLFKQETLDHLYMVCIVSELNSITSASNIIAQSTVQQPPHSIYPTHNNNNFINSLLFTHDEPLLNPSDLIPMYNNIDNVNTSTSDTDTTQLVNQLYESVMSSPTTPPTYHFHGYRSGSSDSSMDGSGLTTPLLDHETALLHCESSGGNSFKSDISISASFFDTNNLSIDNDSMLMISPYTATCSKEDTWGYDVYAP